MKRKDCRGRPLDFERGQIHEQIDLAPDEVNGSGRHRISGPDFRSQLNQPVDAYDAQRKPDAILYVTRRQERQIRGFVAYPENPLRYRGHRVVIVAEPGKL